MTEQGRSSTGLVARWRLLMTATTDPRLRRSDIAVLAAILDRMDRSGKAWPSLGTIATDSLVSRSHVTKVVAQLRQIGYLVVESGNRKESNVYRIGAPRSIPQEPTSRLPQEPTGRLQETSEVGSCGASEVGSCGSPKPALQATSTIEPAKERAAGAAPLAGRKLTFGQWIDTFPADADNLLAGHPVLDYVDDIGLPDEFGVLAWEQFKRRYTEGADALKTSADWPGLFYRSVEGNWAGLWRINSDGEYVLTTSGQQAMRALDAAEERCQ